MSADRAVTATMPYQNLQDYLNKTMTPRASPNTALLTSESTILQETVSASQTSHSHTATAAAAQSSLKGDHGEGKQDPGTRLSAQLADYLISPSAEDPYNGVAKSEGIDVVEQHMEDMKKHLDGWEKDWQKMSARNK